MYRVNKMIGSRCNRVFVYGLRRVAHLFHDSAAQQRSTAQRGSLLLEYMVVMVLALLTAMWAVSAWADKKEMLKIESQARWMQTLQQATEHYIEQYGHQLIKAEPNSAQWLDDYLVANWQHPSVQDLQELGLLTTAFSTQVEPAAKIWVFKQEPCTTEPCFLHALIAADRPFVTAQGQADAQALSLWRELTQGQGLTVQAPYQQWIAAEHFRWPNSFSDQGALAEGSVALAVRGEQLWHRYLRVGDDRDPLFQNSVTAQGALYSAEAVRSAGYLAMQKQADVGDACPEAGAIAHHEQLPALLLCQDGQWQWVSVSDGGHYITDEFGDCKHPQLGDTSNPITGTCNCGSGFYPTVVAVFFDESSNLYRSHLCRPRLTRY